MRLMDYKLFSHDERLQYLSSQKMTTGIPYFGGKSKIGKYIYNTIFNMAVTMHDNNDKPRYFIDAFTGGGKMGLSMPDGWFEYIVINDLDYGVYCYYKCCQENYRLLLATVDKLVDNMSEQLFFKCLEIRYNRQLDPYMCGAMTYVCAACSFNNILNKDKANYRPGMGDNNEKQELDKVKTRAHRTITKVAKQLKRRNYIIENLSYEQLIAKYNGLDWQSVEWSQLYMKRKEQREDEEKDKKILHTPYNVDDFRKEEPELFEKYRNKGKKDYEKISRNILWYLDPPYHPYCLNGMDNAPYANSFDYDSVVYMTNVLSGENKDYGELHYFIKSDYNPKVTVKNAKNQQEKIGATKETDMSKSEKKIYDQCKEILAHEEEMEHDFDSIEDESKGFQCFCVGGFDKGAIAKEDEKLVKTVGYEYVWCKGLPAGYKDIPKEKDKD